MKIVAAKRRGSALSASAISIHNRRGQQRPDGALGLALGSFPVQSIVLPLITVDFHRVLAVLRRVIFFFRRHQLLANTNRRYLILANSPEQNFLLARVGVEVPRVAPVHQRYRRGPILRADIQRSRSVRFFHQTVHFLIFPREIRAALGVLGFVSRRDDLLSVWPENIQHRFFFAAAYRREECAARALRRWKGLLTRLLRYGARG